MVTGVEMADADSSAERSPPWQFGLVTSSRRTNSDDWTALSGTWVMSHETRQRDRVL